MRTHNMAMQDCFERVCAGLRALKKGPDALLFIDDVKEWTWDLPSIALVTVFHTSSVVCAGWGSDDTDCPFVPMWYDEYPDAMLDVKRFMSAYSD